MSDAELLDLLYATMAHGRRRLKDVADDLNVQAGSICRWRKTNKLSPGSRELIAVWLAGQGVYLNKQDNTAPPTDDLLDYVVKSWQTFTPAERGEIVATIENIKERKNAAADLESVKAE